MKELERRAILGDRQAQKDCAEKGIVLPCPWCKHVPTEEDVFPDYSGWIIYHDCKIAGHMRIKAKTRLNLILRWNARPAPPFGRCKDCSQFRTWGECNRTGSDVQPDDYCSYFEPK